MNVDEFIVRLIVAAGIAGAASIAAIVSRRGRAWRRRPFASTDLEPGIHLFTSNDCRSCQRARAVIEQTGLSFSDHTYESEGPLLAGLGIDRVPTVAWIPADGRSGWVAEGTPTARMLLRWLGP